MGISQDVIQQVRDQATIDGVVGKVVSLHSTGRGKMKGLCPFHQEDTPSFTVDTNAICTIALGVKRVVISSLHAKDTRDWIHSGGT